MQPNESNARNQTMHQMALLKHRFNHKVTNRMFSVHGDMVSRQGNTKPNENFMDYHDTNTGRNGHEMRRGMRGGKEKKRKKKN